MNRPATPASQQVPTERILALDGVRGLAILAVMLHHFYGARLLWMGVDLFFVLSGFLITGILVRSRGSSFARYIGHFYQRRAQRILPSYAVVLLLNALIWGFWFLKAYWYYFLGGMNFLTAWNIYVPVSLSALWSLAVEEQFYLVWPLAVFLLPRRALAVCAAAMLVAAPVLRYLYTPYFGHSFAIYALLPFRMDCLAMGALIALLWPTLRDRLSAQPALRHTLCAAAIALAVLASAALVWMGRHGITTASDSQIGNTWIYVCSLLCVTSVLAFALLGYLQPLFTFRPLVWMGTISYSIYLAQYGFYAYLRFDAHVSHPGIWAFPLTVLYGAASWYLLESPILRLGRGDARTVATSLRPVAR